jgi:division protein CdvB (Snf7/Vps24/ESCRT-III family)
MEIAKQLEMTKERVSIDRENLMGTGLNNGRSMETVVKALDRAKGRANAMAEVRDILKSIGTTAEISQEQIDTLSNKLKDAGMRKGDIA